jgi:hypothetical protein
MHKNVSPIYRFEVSLPDDQDNSNNINNPSKEVRYYIKKSDFSAIISVDNAKTVPDELYYDVDKDGRYNYVEYIKDEIPAGTDAEKNAIAGYMNYRALRDGLEALGYGYEAIHGFDLFDRSA